MKTAIGNDRIEFLKGDGAKNGEKKKRAQTCDRNVKRGECAGPGTVKIRQKRTRGQKDSGRKERGGENKHQDLVNIKKKIAKMASTVQEIKKKKKHIRGFEKRKKVALLSTLYRKGNRRAVRNKDNGG